MICLCLSCGQRKAVGPATEVKDRPFPIVQVPGMLTEPEERASYAVEYFWEGFLSMSGLCDSAHVNGVSKSDVEGQFANYVALLQEIPREEAVSAVGDLFSAVEAAQKKDSVSNVYSSMSEYMTKYLYDPNSPYRDEDLYLPYVCGLAESPLTSPGMRPAYGFDVRMCSLNRVGTKAADISFKDLTGKIHTLYGVKADFTLLFFSNPGCPSCADITRVIEGDPVLNEMEKSGRLAVVNVYIDQELDKWREYAASYPKQWLSGYDYRYVIREDLTYNVRAIPSLYLLDRDKTVLFKDAPQERIFSYLSSLSGN